MAELTVEQALKELREMGLINSGSRFEIAFTERGTPVYHILINSKWFSAYGLDSAMQQIREWNDKVVMTTTDAARDAQGQY